MEVADDILSPHGCDAALGKPKHWLCPILSRLGQIDTSIFGPRYSRKSLHTSISANYYMSIIIYQLKPNTPDMGIRVIVMAQQLESANFTGVSYMLPNAETLIIVAHFHHTYGLRGIDRQALRVEATLCLSLGDVLGGDRQVLVYHLVHSVFQLLHLFWTRAS